MQSIQEPSSSLHDRSHYRIEGSNQVLWEFEQQVKSHRKEEE